MNLLTGLLAPTAGTVRVKGQDIAGIGPVMLARRGMARAFQLVHIFPSMTVAETIAVAVVSQSDKAMRFFTPVREDAAVNARVNHSLSSASEHITERRRNPRITYGTTL